MTNTIHNGTQGSAIGLAGCVLVGGFLAAFSVRAAGAQDIARPTISVYGVKAIGVSRELAEVLQENLESNLLKYDRFSVLTRRDIDLILAESRFSQVGLCDDEDCLVEAGNFLGLQKIVTGTISRLGRTYSLVLKVIDVKSGQLDASANGRHAGNEDQLFDVCEQLLAQLLYVADTLTVDTATIDTTALQEEAAADVSLSFGKEDTLALHEQTPPQTAPSPEEKAHARRIGIGAVIIMGALATAFLVFQCLE